MRTSLMSGAMMNFQIGVNVLVIRDGSVLLGLRRNCFGAGTWGLPGGHLEFGESLVDAAARELKEETGLHADAYRFVGVSNTGLSGGDHYVQTAFLAEHLAGEPTLCEPDRCESWKFFPLVDLPRNIFPSHTPLVKGFLTGELLTDRPAAL